VALVKTGSLVSDISGKIGDDVYARNRGGLAVRTLGSWIQPDTPGQVSSRAAMSAISKAWSSFLTPGQRSAWWTYAATHPTPNRWGSRSITNGYAAYIRHNIRRFIDTDSLDFPDAPSSPPLHRPVVAVAVQADAAIVVTGSLSPDVTGTYLPAGEYSGHPYWMCTTPAGTYYIWKAAGSWYTTATLGTVAGTYWTHSAPAATTWYPQSGASGSPTPTWSYDASLARLTTPPDNYPDPPAGLSLYLYSGKPISAGVNYYQGPWRHLATITAPDAAAAGTLWLRWTWPVHATSPAYVWPGDGSGSARAYAVAQDTDTGAISQPQPLFPIIGSLTPWG